jgi:hypothetical protein
MSTPPKLDACAIRGAVPLDRIDQDSGRPADVKLPRDLGRQLRRLDSDERMLDLAVP